MSCILVAEDEAPKFARIARFLATHYPSCTYQNTKSVRSTIGRMLEERFDIIILDMSLPTFDIGAGESGGRPQGFGGLEVVRFMQDEGLSNPFVVLTQYEEFPSGADLVSVERLREMIEQEAPSSFRGLVLYNNVSDGWEAELVKLLDPLASPLGNA